jgi:hypothetical protein
MTRQEIRLAKKRGRPATGRGVTVGIRCHEDLLTAVDEWRIKEPDHPSRATAIRRLAEQALRGKKVSRQRSAAGTKSASAMAGKVIDELADKSAPSKEQASRKERLLQGPKEFRKMMAKPRKAK